MTTAKKAGFDPAPNGVRSPLRGSLTPRVKPGDDDCAFFVARQGGDSAKGRV
jgi:hypothetical protein